MADDNEYVTHPKKNDEKSSMWQHFLISKNKQNLTAKCKYCKKIIGIKGGSTKGMHVHYKSKHSFQKEEDVSCSKRPTAETHSSSSIVTRFPRGTETDDDMCTPSKRQKKINDYFISPPDNDSMDAVLARMTSLDGLSFRVFITSVDLRLSLEARGFTDIPKSVTSIRNRILAYHKKILNYYLFQFQTIKKNGGCFSLTLDEWTSSANKRYLNVNVHSFDEKSKFWNLGLARIKGSLPAQSCVDLLKKKLEEFNISLDNDVVCVSNDGASVMKKFGKLIKPQQQLCFAHAIHLAVLDVLYSKDSISDDEEKQNEDDEVDNDEDDCDEYYDEYECNAEDYLKVIIGNDKQNKVDLTKHYDLVVIVEKIRKVVKLFRRSPVKNSLLQDYVKDKHGKELSLILDCPTRWNSLVDMLERFVQLKDCIRKALIDLESPIIVTNTDFEVAQNIVHCLEPVKLTVEGICRRDANLATADASFKFLFRELGDLNTKFSINLEESLKKRISERRTIMSGVMDYLQNPNKQDSEDTFFNLPPTNKIATFVKNILESLSRTDLRSQHEPYTINLDEDSEDELPLSRLKTAENLSLKTKLDKAITNAMKPVQQQLKGKSDDVLKVVKTEMILFENGGLRGLHLQRCYELLITVQPTSVESERVFSSASSLATRIRSRLADSTLDSLVMLRSHFLSK